MSTPPSPTTSAPHLSPAVEHVLRAHNPTQELISELRSMAIQQPKLVKATRHKVHPPRPDAPPPPQGDPPAPESITSWKMLEHLYRQSPCPFPTLARGLFTTWTSEEDVPEPLVSKRKDKPEVWKREEEGGQWKIVARGYDKFFNVGEVGWTEWTALAMNTKGPYELTLKSNGCLILVAALTPSRLLVTSKHSLGTRTRKEAPADGSAVGEATSEAEVIDEDDNTSGHPGAPPQVSHAERGEDWLFTHLKQVGKTEADLAKVLWERNVTAVAELCDDSFEEHVLPIPKELTGLVLHGLVPNSPSFDSLPAREVADFAKQWGFKPTEIVTLDSIPAVLDFCREGAKKGEWEGVGVEGWVVRCRVAQPSENKVAAEEAQAADPIDALTEEVANLVIADPGDQPVQKDKKGKMTKTPPYPPGAPFFFKVKFEEPYLMYREWRELTKTLLPVLDGIEVVGHPETVGRSRAKGSKKDPIKVGDRFKKRPETRVYLNWVINEMIRNPNLFRHYGRNLGIIEVRDKFLKWASTPGVGKEVWDNEVGKSTAKAAGELDGQNGDKVKKVMDWKKTIIVPIAIPGCGKTSVAVALKELYDIGHTQSDNVAASKTAPQFLRNIAKLLETNTIVFADRNNHLEQHRKQIREVAKACKVGPVRLVALNWSQHSVPMSTTHRLMSTRLIARGDNHQSLRAKKDDVRFHEEILWKFITSTEPLNEDEVDEVIDMDPTDGFEDNIRRAVKELAPVIGWDIPSEEKLKDAIEAARNYKVDLRKEDQKPSKKEKTQKIRYYALLAEVDLRTFLDDLLAEGTAVDPGLTKFWTHLTTKDRVNKRPHVTLVHEADPENEDKAAFWADCEKIANSASPPLYEFTVSHVITDGRVMSLVLSPDSLCMRPQEGDNALEKPTGAGWGADKMKRLHITVGTGSSGIGNVEGGKLVAKWRDGKSNDVHVLKLDPEPKIVGTLKGFAY
ncbi:hypothetical protein CALCODRAFT_499280 [Calocera cornea HHB12733]|uniref:tRNA ligase n=1 Tax=Calocera cornea HHB12733 TaxID=1353952 RepID=A0A165EH86_9BASI|nr:hypothetical protein CALCODRAFT_499280 [Calocera cornea HHB12733]